MKVEESIFGNSGEFRGRLTYFQSAGVRCTPYHFSETSVSSVALVIDYSVALVIDYLLLIIDYCWKLKGDILVFRVGWRGGRNGAIHRTLHVGGLKDRVNQCQSPFDSAQSPP
jgi:hypothetical protein